MIIDGVGRLNPRQRVQRADDVVDGGHRGMHVAFESAGKELVRLVEMR